ncbi:MAG: DUF1648 domain-containing protein [Phycisphaerae bacterium]|jgi:uncharacterized membrane protein
MRKIHWFIIVVILLIPIMGILFYPHLPQKMGTHWQFSKTPDGYMDKFGGTFLAAAICVISPTILLVINILASVFKTNNKSKNIGLFFMDYFTAILSTFLLAVYTAVLVWNYGVDFSMPIFACFSVGLLLISVLVLVISAMNEQKKIMDSAGFNNRIPSDGKYKDSLIEISQDNIIFKDYYFPMGSKSVTLSQVEYVEAKKPTLCNGKWRLHGTGDLLFRIWFPADYNRPSRDTIFVMKIKNKWTKIGFTAENSYVVSELFKNKGLLRQR